MRIGIDIGGTKILAGIVDKSGNVINKKKILINEDKSYSTVKNDITALINDILKDGGLDRRDINRIGFACAGQIDKTSQNILFSPNLGWRDAPLKRDFERLLGIETFVENDVNAATYGEWRFGLNGKPDDVVGVFIGTGIGGGLIIDRRLYRGFANVGGELGHVIVNPYGYKCNCGNYGCFEAYCGGSYIVSRVKKKIEEGYRGKLWDIIDGNVDTLNAGHVEEAYFEGDELCGGVWLEVIEYTGAAMAGVINLLNPEVIIFGGGVVYGTRCFVDDVKEEMEKRAMHASLKGLVVERAILGEDSAILGAAFCEV